jgi:cytochrome c oxidase subunit 4
MAENHVVVPVKVYLAIFLALMVFTGITAYAAFQDFGRWNTIVAITIAIIKATLVVLYFMHVRYSNHLIWVVVASGFMWLAILLALTLTDYISRSWLVTYG